MDFIEISSLILVLLFIITILRLHLKKVKLNSEVYKILAYSVGSTLGIMTGWALIYYAWYGELIWGVITENILKLVILVMGVVMFYYSVETIWNYPKKMGENKKE